MKDIILTIVVSTYNRPLFLSKLIDSIDFSSKKIELIIIDDNSTVDYIVNTNRFIKYFKNKNSKHKFYNFLFYRPYYSGKYVCLVDDKDIFEYQKIPDLINILSCSDSKIVAFDYYNNNKIIGKKFTVSNFYEFRYKKCFYGDKFILFRHDVIDNFLFDFNSIGDDVITNFDLIIEENIFEKADYYDLHVINHKYLKGGITDNNLSYKRNNEKYRKILYEKQMKNKSCLKYKILKSFEIFLIYKKIQINIPYQYKIIFLIMRLFFVFYFIEKYYIYKLKKVTSL